MQPAVIGMTAVPAPKLRSLLMPPAFATAAALSLAFTFAFALAFLRFAALLIAFAFALTAPDRRVRSEALGTLVPQRRIVGALYRAFWRFSAFVVVEPRA